MGSHLYDFGREQAIRHMQQYYDDRMLFGPSAGTHDSPAAMDFNVEVAMPLRLALGAPVDTDELVEWLLS